jgi:hypothetical protein
MVLDFYAATSDNFKTGKFYYLHKIFFFRGQKDKQRSKKNYIEKENRATPTPPKTGDESMCSGRVFRKCRF